MGGSDLVRKLGLAVAYVLARRRATWAGTTGDWRSRSGGAQLSTLSRTHSEILAGTLPTAVPSSVMQPSSAPTSVLLSKVRKLSWSCSGQSATHLSTRRRRWWLWAIVRSLSKAEKTYLGGPARETSSRTPTTSQPTPSLRDLSIRSVATA